jgi:hypothetical protein
MPARPNIPDPAAIERAFQMAGHLPSKDKLRLRVGVLSSEGVMLAGGELRGLEQAAFLRDQLQIIGFFEFLPEGMANSYGCDLLLKQQAGAGEERPDDFLRTPVGSVWPPRRPRRRSPRSAKGAA